MSKNVIIYGAIIGILLIGLVAAAVVAVMAFRGASEITTTTFLTETPEEASFPTEEEHSTSTPIVEDTPVPTVSPTPIPTATETASEEMVATATDTVSSAAGEKCGMSGDMFILFIGQDGAQGLPPYGADAIRMAKIDFDTNKAAVFAFQRDLKLPTPNLLSSYGISEYYLGSTYHAVIQRVANQPDPHTLATSAVAQILYDNFGILADHYVTLDENFVAKFIDEIGGIDVAVPEKFVTPIYTFNPGSQHFNGNQTWEYITYEENRQAEAKRLNRQEIVFDGLREKILSPSILSNVVDIYNVVSSSVVTDFSVEQILSLACVFENLPNDQVTFTTFPDNMITQHADSSMTLNDIVAAKQLVEDTFDW
ncbi:MAG: LCP family protein [Anaerolineaceae bacterium]|nr:LCP family protein [Anaerolineaceae bacterium]